MDTITEVTDTERVIASMLVENTGRHFLDSGGAYGRSWERNRAAAGDDPVAYFRERPEARQGWHGEEWAIVDVFHWLVNRVDYHRDTDRRWRAWVWMEAADRYSRERYSNGSGTVDDWIDLLVDKGWAERCEFGGGYTYNDECALSQDIVWTPFALTDECPWVEFPTEMIAISIHGGCDARGGFTDFRMFELSAYDGIYDFLDYCDFETVWECDAPLEDPNQLQIVETERHLEPHEFYVSTRAGYAEWYDQQGSNIDEPEQLDADEIDPDGDDPHGCFRRCHCGGVLRITGFYPPHTS